jgi:hypothetical protein
MRKGEIPKAPHYGKGVNIELKTRRDAEIRRAEEGRALDKATREKARLDKISKSVTHPKPTFQDRMNKKLGKKGSLERFMKGNAIMQSGYENPNTGKLYDVLKSVVTKVSGLTGSIVKFGFPRVPQLSALMPGELADGTLEGANLDEMSVEGFANVVEAVNEETILDKNMSRIIDGQAMAVKVLNAEDLRQSSAAAAAGDWGSDEFSGGTASGFSFTKDSSQSRMLAEQGWDESFENSQNTIGAIVDLEGNLGATLTQGISDLINNNNFNFGRLAVSFLQSVANSAVAGAASGISSGLTAWFMEGVKYTGANGGVAPGGFKAFANGGVVKKPTFGLIGEGKFNEAVVPLPDGKSIPISGKMSGDTENNINITINMGTESGDGSSTDKQSEDGVSQLAGNITKLVQQELVEQRRPGGLLYQ